MQFVVSPVLGGQVSFEDFWEFPIEDSLVLARPHVQGLFLLNSSARLIWELLPRALSIDALAHEFGTRCGISQDRAETDIRATLDNWSEGLLAPAAEAVLACGAVSESTEVSFTDDYRLHGQRFRVAVDDEDVRNELAPRLGPLRCEAEEEAPAFKFQVTRERRGLAVHLGSECLSIEESASAARIVLLQEMTRLCKPGREWLAVLHAAACASGDRTVLLAGGTHAGKSTLSAALMHGGFTCLSDDSAPVERGTQWIAGMPFALMLREGSWPVLRSRFPALEDEPMVSRYGQRVRFLPANIRHGISASATARALVFSGYAAAASTALVPLGKFERLVCLQESGFWVPHSRDTIGAFLAWVGSLPAYRLSYSDLDEAVAVVREVLHG